MFNVRWKEAVELDQFQLIGYGWFFLQKWSGWGFKEGKLMCLIPMSDLWGFHYQKIGNVTTELNV